MRFEQPIGSWRGRAANFVFAGVNGAPPTDFGDTALGKQGRQDDIADDACFA